MLMFIFVAVLAVVFGVLAIAVATEPALWTRPTYRPATPSAVRVARYVRRVGAHGRGTL